MKRPSRFVSHTLADSAACFLGALNKGRRIYARVITLVSRNAKQAVCLMLLVSLFSTSTPAAPQTISSMVSDLSTSAKFWFHRSGWDASLERIFSGQKKPDAKPVERQKDRDARVARIEIYPGDVTIQVDEQVAFAAVAYDQDGNAVGGVHVKWSSRDEGRNRAARVSQRGDFVATIPGNFQVVVETDGGKKAHVKVVVTEGVKRKSSDKPERTREVSTRDLRPVAVVQTNKKNGEQLSHQASISRKDNKAFLSHAVVAKASAAAMPMPADDSWGGSNYESADDPGNTRGNPLGGPQDGGAGNGNFQIAAPVMALPGRGIDVNLGLAYNSRLWNKANPNINFDIDRDWPAPGWSLGFGKVVGMGVDNGSMIIDADGTRHAFAGTVTYGPNLNYTDFAGHTTDGTFIDYKHHTGLNGVMISAEARHPNGTVIEYGAQGTGAMYPTRITDANGNYITITYVNNTGPQIQTVTDTLGRVINFHYDANNLLTAITAPTLGTDTRTLVRLHYTQLPLNYSFSGLTPVVRNSTPWVIDAIYYPATSTGYWFGDTDSYSSYGMLTKVVEQRGMGFSATSLNDQGTVTPGLMTQQKVYDFQYTNLTDAPTFTSMTETWTRDGVNTDQATTHYEVHENTSPRTVTVTLPNGVKSTQYSYNYSSLPQTDPLKALDGLVYLDETRDSNNALLQSSVSTWEPGAYDSPRPTRVEATDERDQMTATDFSYGPVYNQVTEARNYDYGGQTLLRSTRTQYVNSASYTSRHIFNLPTSVEVYASDNTTRVSRTEYQYDEQTLADTPGVVMHNGASNPYAPQFLRPGRCYYDYNEYGYFTEVCEPDTLVSAYDPTTDYRGLVTQVTTYTDAGEVPASGAITESRRYDITGNLVTASTSCCQQTSVSFTQATQYAYPESQTRGSSDPNSSARVTTSATYDFNTGLGLSSTNSNGQTVQTTYFADTLRPDTAYLPTGANSSYQYDEVGISITETTKLADGTVANQNVKFLNGRGQVRREKALGANNVWDLVDVQYDVFGRATQQSLPYRSGDTLNWSITTYDALGRVKTIQAPDGSIMTQAFYNEASPSAKPDVASNLPGQTTRVVDAWGRERWGRMDSSDRLVEVVEPKPDGDGTVAVGGYLTTYSYDTLGNLTEVSQGTQTRSFRYDSLGRITRQKLSEASATLNNAGQYDTSGGGMWSDFFTYDDRSNLISRIDARGVKTAFNYNDDPLNRLQSISFDTTGFGDTAHPVIATPPITYAYVTTGDITRVSSVTTEGVSVDSVIYDSEGRIANRTQTLANRQAYPMETDYIYDTLGRVKQVRYPAEYGTGTAPRKVVEHNYDVASRLSGLKVGGTDYASQIVYNAASQSTSLQVGAAGANQINESYDYDPQRGFLTNQKVWRGTGSSTNPLLDLSYDYLRPNTTTGRTGQLTRIINNLDASRSKDRNYEYDALSRLVKATGGAAASPVWTQNYAYDRFGNRLSVTATDSLASLTSPKQAPQTAELAANTHLSTTESVREDARRSISDSPFSIFSSTPRRSSSGRANSQPMFSPPPQPSPSIVISQIYGGGGNTGATFKNDFIELFNRGTTTVDLTGWSVQYAAPGSSAWQATTLSGSLAPGQYYLVQEAQGAGGTVSLPTPNASGNVEMNATAGKVALVNNSTTLSVASPLSASGLVDFVGYGSSAGSSEGSGPAPAPSNTTAAVRASQGCIETDNNATDFDGGTPSPRNTATATHTCSNPASSTTLVISEFRTRGTAGGNDEFVELYNKSDAAINISGWKIKTSNNAGTVTTRVVINAGTTLPAHGHFLATSTGTGGYSGSTTGDQTFTSGIADDGGIAVTGSDNAVVDQVGMSTGSAFKENRTLSPLTTSVDRSYERRAGGTSGSGQDTNDSPSDFQIKNPCDPQNLASVPTPQAPANQPPATNSGGPYSGTNGAAISFNGANSSDPDGTITGYAWEFGDGATGTGATPQHVYTSAGTFTVKLTVTDNQSAQSNATTTATIAGSGGTGCSSSQPLSAEQFIKNFYQAALNRQPTSAELQSWNNLLRQSYYQGQAQLLQAAKNMGQQIFTSNEYLNRNRTDHEYVYDLYKAYLQRDPEQPAWDTWTSDVATVGRDNVRGGFDASLEFAQKMSSVCPGTNGGIIPADGIANLSYEETSNRIKTTGYEYDAAGNLTRSQSTAGAWQRFEYDAAGRLINVKTDNNILIASYTYGATNQRLASVEGNLRTYYAWGGESTLAEYIEADSSGVVQWSKSYVYLGARLLATLQPNGSGGEITQYHHPDRLGTRLITNASDTSVQEQVTLPFGTALEAESTGGTNRRFTSYDRSIGTGLDYAVNRHYDSQQGRFIQVDPIGMNASSLENPQTLNLYAYCGNDPVNHTDPNGLFWGKLWRGLKKVLSNKWVRLAIGVALTILLFNPSSLIIYNITNTGGIIGVSTGLSTLGHIAVGLVGILPAGSFLQSQQEEPKVDDVIKVYTKDCKNGNKYPDCAGVGQPGTLERLIPIWGPGRAAIDDFQNGHWGWGILHGLEAISDFFLLKALWKSGVKLFTKEATTQTFETIPRVVGQLGDSRLGPLAGRLTPSRLNELLNNPAAQRLLDTATGNINVIQQVDGVLLRITVPRDALRIISVGPIRANQVTNGISSGRFIPLP
jgi:RHS repeat-associated protein